MIYAASSHCNKYCVLYYKKRYVNGVAHFAELVRTYRSAIKIIVLSSCLKKDCTVLRSLRRPVQCTHSHSCCSHSADHVLSTTINAAAFPTHLRSMVTRNLIHLHVHACSQDMTQLTGSILLTSNCIVLNGVQTMIWLPTIM